MFICPVCSYDKMRRPPSVGYICPCCGVEFEVDDYEMSHGELRRLWVSRGMPWFSRATPAPVGWNALLQLVRAGHVADLYAMTGRVDTVKRTATALRAVSSSSLVPGAAA